LRYRTRDFARTDAAEPGVHMYVVVVRRYQEATDAKGKNVCTEIIPFEYADRKKRYERVHKYTLVPAEVTRNETHPEAEVQASKRRNGSYEKCCMPVVRHSVRQFHRVGLGNEGIRVLSVGYISAHMADESRIEKRKQEKQKGGGDDGSEFWSYVALVGIIGVVVVVAYFIFFSGGAAAEIEPWEDVKSIEGEDPTMVAADADANDTDEMVEVIYYGDFGCPACVNFERNVFSRLKDEYIATGEVKFVFRPVDYQAQSDPDSRRAALGALTLWEQNPDAYWTWHRTMFANYDARANWATASQIGSFASDAGADGDSIAQSVSQNEFAAQIQAHRSQARGAGIQGTPSFIINDTVVTGGEYSSLTSEIDSELEG